MQPITLTIHGDYWDSFIYKGKLYIWAYSEELTIYDWDQIVDFLAAKYSLEVYEDGLHFSFKNGRSFYESYPEDKKPFLRDQLIHLSTIQLELSQTEISRFRCATLENPFPELATDIEIFKDVIYGGTDSGLYKVHIEDDDLTFDVGRQSTKIWGETEVIRLKISNAGRVALSTGPDGLFEYRIGDYWSGTKNWFQVSKLHSSFADWNYSSIYNSSDEGNSFLALFEKVDTEEKAKLFEISPKDFQVAKYYKTPLLHQSATLSQKQLFNLNGNTMSWGNGNKIYLWNDNQVLKTDFFQYKVDSQKTENQVTNKVAAINLKNDYNNNSIISAGVTYFGIIVELEDSLLIIYEDGRTVINFELQMDITKWRAFPRSVRYENQVHVVTNNALKILSFNSDFFNEQRKKQLGMKYLG